MPQVLRAAVATSLVALLGALAHGLSGGPVPPLALALLVGAVAPLAWAVLRVRRPTLVLSVALGGGQLIVHTLLSSMMPSTASAPGGSAAGAHLTHQVPAQLLDLTVGPAVGPLVPVAGHAGTSATGMLLAHVLATLALTLVLRHGEDGVWALAGRLLVLPHPRGPLRRWAPTLSVTHQPWAVTDFCTRSPRTRAPPTPVC